MKLKKEDNPKLPWMSVKSVKDDKPIKEVQGRSPFLKAYGVVVHNSRFRRLSHKTQLFLNPSTDYERSRLAHSIEVAQIGRQLTRIICPIIHIDEYQVNSDNEYYRGRFHRDFEDLVATACLSHDIGHAPFGHAGEKELDKMMKGYDLIFDANKQNIRLLLGSHFRPPLSVPYSLVDAVMKYKKETFQKGGFYLEEEGKVLKILKDTQLRKIRHPACYLMEAADDIAYICGDIEDLVKNKLITQKELLCFLIKFPFLNRNYEEESDPKAQWEKLLCENFNKDPRAISSALMKLLITHFEKVVNDFKNIDENIEDLPSVLHKMISKNKNKESNEKKKYFILR